MRGAGSRRGGGGTRRGRSRAGERPRGEERRHARRLTSRVWSTGCGTRTGAPSAVPSPSSNPPVPIITRPRRTSWNVWRKRPAGPCASACPARPGAGKSTFIEAFGEHVSSARSRPQARGARRRPELGGERGLHPGGQDAHGAALPVDARGLHPARPRPAAHRSERRGPAHQPSSILLVRGRRLRFRDRGDRRRGSVGDCCGLHGGHLPAACLSPAAGDELQGIKRGHHGARRISCS